MSVLAACLAFGGVVGTSVTAAASSQPRFSGSPVVIPLLSPFSGGSAFIGQLGYAIAVPAAYEINNAGGILGHQLTLAEIDTKNDPADALPLMQQFLATHSNVVAIAGPQSTEAPTLVPILNKDKIVMFGGAGESEFNRSPYNFFWRTNPPDSANGISMAIYAKRLGDLRVATVFGSDQGSQGDLPGVLTAIKELHLDLVSQVNLQPDQPSYQSQVARLISEHPQAIMTETDPQSAGTFFGEWFQQNPKATSTKLIGTEASALPTYIQAVQGAIGKSKFAQTFAGVVESVSSPNPATNLEKQGLVANKSKIPNALSYLQNPFFLGGYGSFILEALAMTAAHSIKPSVYNSFINGVGNPGPGKVVVYSYAKGVQLLKQGKKIQYIGPAGPYNFNKWHNSFAGQVAEQYLANGSVKPLPNGVVTTSQIQKYPG
ncbi:MAG TPA: ABC transporter substrate-binding protein [Acidimicrobiales bacterium]|nr:ABC transporter substrate-binding protein [Acidimicrobiales bacterium]